MKRIAYIVWICCFTVTTALAIDFETQVKPILAANCLGCHAAQEPAAGLDVSTIESIFAGSQSRPVLVPGDPENSLFLQVITGDAEPLMPPDPLLPPEEEEIELIRQWILSLGDEADPSAEENTDTEPDQVESVATPPVVQEYDGEFDEIGAVAFHPSEPVIAVGKLHAVELYRIDKENRELRLLNRLHGHDHLVRSIAFHPNGETLVAAGGRPGIEGEIIRWDIATGESLYRVTGHRDCIYDIEFSPDGETIATCSYDKSLQVWDAETGESQQTLLDHVDAVYAIAYSPDGTRIASAAGDRTIKLWDVETGERTFTLSQPLEAQYALAFSPDGTQLAAAGEDRTIRIWDINESGGSIVQSKFSHEGAVLDLHFSASADRLFTTGEDRFLKAWRTSDYQEDKVWGPMPDLSFAIAVSHDDQWIAAGCYDGSLQVYDVRSGEYLLSLSSDEAETMTIAEVDEPAQAESREDGSFRVQAVEGNGTYISALQSLNKKVMRSGEAHTVVLHGKNLDDAIIETGSSGIDIRITNVEKKPLPTFTRADFTTAAEIADTGYPFELTLEITIADDVRQGVHRLWAHTPWARTNSVAFAVETESPVMEIDDAENFLAAPEINPPCIAAGSISEVGDTDVFRFEADAGQELVFDVMASAIGSGLNSSLEIVAMDGTVLATSDRTRRDARMGYRFDEAGEYVVRIGDENVRAGGMYRLHVTESPLVERVFPLGARQGTEATFHLTGYNLGSDIVTIEFPASEEERNQWQPFDFDKGAPLQMPTLVWSDKPEIVETEGNDTLDSSIKVSVPGVVNGTIDGGDEASDEDWYRFDAKAGEPVVLAVYAQQLGSPLDSVIDIYHEDGTPVEIATVRCISETFLTLSDRDSRAGGMRLDNYNELEINDYVMVGSEILQITKLPDYPDEDVLFARNDRFGWRYGLFGTTTSHHAVYTPAYQVEIHPPGKTFAPNGLPVYTLYARNDDGGAPKYRRDSYFRFDPPAEGTYHVRLADRMNQSGPDYAYRLELRPPEPDFNLYISSTRPNIHQNGRYSMSVAIDRLDGFDSLVNVTVTDLPTGFYATDGEILPEEESCWITLWADETADSMELGDDPVTVRAIAYHDQQEIIRESKIEVLTVTHPADVTITMQPNEIIATPGQSVRCTLSIERHNGFTGRIPLSVQNLPFGTYVMDTGLNGILIREGETERTIEIYVEPWVAPLKRSIYSIANVETRSPMPHRNASNSCMLRIIAPSIQSAMN